MMQSCKIEDTYYLESNKKTPEFSSINDEKIIKIICEMKKTLRLFKDT
jgi:hypothetical protein